MKFADSLTLYKEEVLRLSDEFKYVNIGENM
jgi:hypothetical protein